MFHLFNVTGSWREAPGPSSFAYPFLEGLTQWYRTDTGILGSSSEVTGWEDQSGGGNDLGTFGTGTNVQIENIGGIDFVRCFNNAKYLFSTLNAPARPDGKSKLSFFAVLHSFIDGWMFNWGARSTNVLNRGVAVNKSSEGTFARLYMTHVGGGARSEFATPSGSWVSAETVILDVQMDLTLGNSEEVVMTINDFETSSASFSESVFTCATNDFVMGQPTVSGIPAATGVAELLVYNDKVLTEDERDTVLSYLANKYSLTLGA